ncbi:uncharacterized protein [Rutidosis leptorrhynchoides]|uniref:uncharacterized protein n=1 Tax=Rutidosis leptorrhynchoides TaxID=125765 RepID=UPI003A9A0B7A
MDAAVIFNHLNDLHPDIPNPHVRVQVFAVFRKTAFRLPTSLGPMEIILIDQQGGKIIASVDMSLIAIFQDMLVEGRFLHISRFSLVSYDDHCKLIKKEWKIRFMLHTQVLPCVAFHLLNDGYDPVHYNQIINSVLHPRIAFDVVGQLVELRALHVNYRNGQLLQSITFTLQDLEGNRIRGTLWNNLALQLHDYAITHVNDGVPLLCLLNNMLIKQWQVDNTDKHYNYFDSLQDLPGGGMLQGQNGGNNAAFIFI